MNRIRVTLCSAITILLLVGCTTKVVGGPPSNAAGGGEPAAGGGPVTSAGGGGAPVACPPGEKGDQEVEDMVGEPCSEDADQCASNNGCGGCSITCKEGTWTPTNVDLCFFLGSTC